MICYKFCEGHSNLFKRRVTPFSKVQYKLTSKNRLDFENNVLSRTSGLITTDMKFLY